MPCMTYVNTYMFRHRGAILRVPKHIGVDIRHVRPMTECMCWVIYWL